MSTAISASLNDLPPQSENSIGVTKERPFDIVNKQVEDFMSFANDKMLAEGKSQTVQFFSGVVDIGAVKDHPDWANYRSMAILEATAKARENYLKELNVSKAHEEIKEYLKNKGQPEPTADDFKSESSLGALFDKVVAVAGVKLDSMLDESGIDAREFESATPKQKQLLMKKHFATKSIMTAYGDLAGMTVIKTFEQHSNDGKGTIGVVMGLSADKRDRIQTLIEAKGNVQPDPTKATPQNANLRGVFAKNKTIQLEAGTDIWYDEQGYPMLIAYGQSGVTYSTDPDEQTIETEAAYEFAEDNAWGALAQTYNLNGDFSKETIQGKIEKQERIFEFKKGKVNKAQTGIQKILQSSINQSSTMTSSIQDISGVGVRYKWKKQHHITGKDMVGVVVVWHPKSIKATINHQERNTQPSILDAESNTGLGTLEASNERAWDF